MQSLIILPFLVASAFAGNLFTHPVAIQPLPQYNQEQNTATGEYGYSYFGGPSSKTEFRAIDGTTTGAYSYVDAHGLLQTVNYIADEFGFRAAGSNIPNDGLVPADAPDVAIAKAAHLAEHSRATHEALGHYQRSKRGAVYAALPLAPVARVALPLATSSQSRLQIHKSAHLVAEPLIAHHPALLFRKKRSLELQPAILSLATAYTQHLPQASSSQNRFQVHNNAKIIQEIHSPLVAAPIVEAKAALPVLAAPVAALPKAKAVLPLVAPATPIVENLPVSSSSQNRFQIHKGAKLIQEVHRPIIAGAPLVAYPGYLSAGIQHANEAVYANGDSVIVESA